MVYWTALLTHNQWKYLYWLYRSRTLLIIAIHHFTYSHFCFGQLCLVMSTKYLIFETPLCHDPNLYPSTNSLWRQKKRMKYCTNLQHNQPAVFKTNVLCVHFRKALKHKRLFAELDHKNCATGEKCGHHKYVFFFLKFAANVWQLLIHQSPNLSKETFLK